MLNIKIHQGEINGVKYIHLQKDTTNIAYLLFLFKYGTRYEENNLSGIAHFIEHMIFKSTKKRKTNQILQEIEIIGGIANAFTSYELTGFYISVLQDKFDQAFEIFADMLQNSLFNSKEIQIEQGNVIEEIKMYKDNPQDYINLLAQQNIFSDTPLGKSILGSEDIIKQFDQKTLLDIKAKYYNSNNILIASSGNFEVDKLIKNIKKYINLKPGNISQTKVSKFNPKEKIFFFKRKEVEQAHVIIAFESKDYMDENYNYKASILSTILGDGLGSILFRLLREKLGVAYYVGSALYQYQDTGNFNIYFGCNLDKMNKVINKIFQELDKIKNGKLTKKEIERAQNLMYSSISMGLESIKYTTRTLATDLLLKNKIENLEEIKDKIYSVKLSDLQELAIEIFNENYCINYISPEKII